MQTATTHQLVVVVRLDPTNRSCINQEVLQVQTEYTSISAYYYLGMLMPYVLALLVHGRLLLTSPDLEVLGYNDKASARCLAWIEQTRPVSLSS
jgi:hypothetical protein